MLGRPFRSITTIKRTLSFVSSEVTILGLPEHGASFVLLLPPLDVVTEKYCVA